ncbi:unnamed protein product [Thelazia callipaeda]|uniref:Caprin-1_dimer domain-containing protein n=1 Tax=Thelazia callipaeda TaxID=103827 RepID=A0A0N5CYQ7_THECL|nr:unnamed protein product [Thelazia callipaeda]
MKGPESTQCTANSILSNPYAGIQFALEKRRRNLEKRKSRLLQYDTDLKNGKKLSEQQNEARYCIGEVETQLDFLKEIGKVILSLQKDYLRSVKQWEDGLKKEQVENNQKALDDFVYLRNVIDRFNRLEMKETFAKITNDDKKITESECKLMENLSKSFNVHDDEFENLEQFKEKCCENSNIAYKILVGSKEKVMDNSSGLEIKELVNKVANCQLIFDVTRVDDQFVKPVEYPLESDFEHPKEDLKVVFVHVNAGSTENCAENDVNQIGDTEFGFEAEIDPNALVRDPPPPIPFPATVVPEDPTNAVRSDDGSSDFWVVETKHKTSKRRGYGIQNGFDKDSVQVNGSEIRSNERRSVRISKGNQDGGDGKGADLVKSSDGEQRSYGGGNKRQDRDNFDNSRSFRGNSRGNFRGGGNTGGRNAPGAVRRASGIRSSNNNYSSGQTNGSRGGNGVIRGFNGYGCNRPPQPRRQLGFNFASDAF